MCKGVYLRFVAYEIFWCLWWQNSWVFSQKRCRTSQLFPHHDTLMYTCDVMQSQFFFFQPQGDAECVWGIFFFFLFFFSLSCGNFLFLYDFAQACFFLAIFELFPFPKVVSPIYNQFITDLTFYQVWLLISRMRDRSFFYLHVTHPKILFLP